MLSFIFPEFIYTQWKCDAANYFDNFNVAESKTTRVMNSWFGGWLALVPLRVIAGLALSSHGPAASPRGYQDNDRRAWKNLANLGYPRLLAIFSTTAFEQKKVRSQSIAGNLFANAQFGR